MEGGIFLLTRPEFIKKSLEINLFFLRIMKEHLIFIIASLPSINEELIRESEILQRSLEMLLNEVVDLANGAISQGVLDADIIFTPYTLDAEEATSRLTGIPIDTNITRREMDLVNDPNFDYTLMLERQLENINCRARNLTEEVIDLKMRLLNLVLECMVYSTSYPSLIGHITEEAEKYIELLDALMDKEFPKETLCEVLNFWNEVMGEHAEFINGMLDPSERELKSEAARFTKTFEMLREDCNRCSRNRILDRSFKATKDIIEYKTAATVGLLECEILSIIPPLLSDHVLREANYYLKILRELKNLMD